MRAFQFDIEGNWAHFKKPETNNNPLTHDLIPKTALIGLMGAVLGIERQEMKPLLPQLSEDLQYGVQLRSPLKKVSWGFTSSTAIEPSKPGSPKYFEFLRFPAFRILLTLSDERSESLFHNFLKSLRNQECEYPPVLGWHNCPAELSFVSKGDLSSLRNDEFSTKGFVSTQHTLSELSDSTSFRIGFEKLPTYQTEDFWNLPEKYKSIVYPECEKTLIVKGDYYEYFPESKPSEKWWLM